MSKKLITQTGDKAIYIEDNTGAISVNTNSGVLIFDPNNPTQLANLKSTLGPLFDEVKDTIHDLSIRKETPHALTPNPFYSQDFIGREKELNNLYQKLFSGNNFIFLVNGVGGVGKTTLASHYYHEHQGKYRHVAWVLSNNSISSALLQLAPALGLEFNESITYKERLKLLLVKLANLKSPCLLVIDNANKLDDLNDHFGALSGCKNFHVLLTTRITKFAGAEIFPVKGLLEDDAVVLFKKYYKEYDESEDKLLRQIISDVNNNTLIIEILAKNLQNINELQAEYSLKNLHDDLKDSLLKIRNSETVKTKYQATGNGLRNASPEEIILAMYDVNELSVEERKIVSYFSVLSNERLNIGFFKEIFPKVNIKKSLLAVSQKGWIDYNETDKSFKINQVVKDVVKKKYAYEISQDCTPLVHYFVDLTKNTAFLFDSEDFSSSLNIMNHVASVAETLGYPTESLGVLCEFTGRFYDKLGDIKKSAFFHERALSIDVTDSNFNPDNLDMKYNLSVSYLQSGNIQYKKGNFIKALGRFKQLLAISEELSKKHPKDLDIKNNLGIAHEKIGDIYRKKNNYIDMFAQYSKAKRIFEKISKSKHNKVLYRRVLSIFYGKLGDAYGLINDSEKAKYYLLFSLKKAKELSDEYPDDLEHQQSLSISYSKLGRIFTMLDELSDAFIAYKKGITITAKLLVNHPNNIEYKNGIAAACFNLGELYKKAGQLDKWRDNAEKAKKLWEDLVEVAPDYQHFKDMLMIVTEDLEGEGLNDS